MIRIGQGYDVHKLATGRKLILCGVPVPHPTGLLGHSDADVAVHALMDAILGALALGDIGQWFPDSDPAWKDADSMKLLRAVMADPRVSEWEIGNLDLTIIAVCAAVACLGFLWYNTNPASIFMGDTGSLALGGLFAALSIITHTEFLAMIIGGLFVVETLSDVIQVGYFKYTKKKYGAGRRVFKMAPLHHHFELKGWPETKVTAMFVLASAGFVFVTLIASALL